MCVCVEITFLFFNRNSGFETEKFTFSKNFFFTLLIIYYLWWHMTSCWESLETFIKKANLKLRKPLLTYELAFVWGVSKVEMEPVRMQYWTKSINTTKFSIFKILMINLVTFYELDNTLKGTLGLLKKTARRYFNAKTQATKPFCFK